MSNLNSFHDFIDENPPLVLAVDTSSASAGFALARGTKLIASLKTEASVPHSQAFFLQTAELLKIAGVNLNEVQIFAAATGPGSFTGLRVGLAAIKGLAHSLGKPAVGINSIDALALSSKVIGDVLVLIEAGRKEFYSGIRRVTEDGNVQPIGIDRVGTLTALSSELTAQSGIVVGSVPEEFLAEHSGWQFKPSLTTIAEEIALSSLGFLRSGDCSLRPHYVRPSDAEIKRKD
ncbi:MAG: tRNA (adenosine(37)-N6)-threonylcarbamoyltransferase complex dimerization subunit type 1 TsaB [Acidobacteriota bacterium]